MAIADSSRAVGPGLGNREVADRLEEAARLLEQQGANPFRVNAYRQAARSVAGLAEPLAQTLARGGLEALVEIPAVGWSIAAAIREMATTGHWSFLEGLRGAIEPEALFRRIPGVGPALARQIHDSLHATTLEALEVAAHDGRLARVPGIGPRRAAMLRASLAEMLGRRRPGALAAPLPPVEQLLEVDRSYRAETAAGRLRKIAPRRFNPRREAWLPILHQQHGDWHYTALFSNTARAHELDRVFDWVVIFFHSDNRSEGQCTVVTETQGPLAGRRVVRGREAECRDVYLGPNGTAGS